MLRRVTTTDRPRTDALRLRHRQRRLLSGLAALFVLFTLVAAPPPRASAQTASAPTQWTNSPAGRGGRAKGRSAAAYQAMLGRRTTRGERRQQRSLALICPPGTHRTVRLLPQDALERVVGVEQAHRELHCQGRDGVLRGPAVQLRRYLRVSAASLLRRSSLPSVNVVRFGQMKDGKRDGVWVQLDATGRELGRVQLDGGTGTWRVWHRSGALAIDGPLTGGARSGMWRAFFQSGTPAVEGSYQQDQRQGEWRWFFSSGEPMRTITFLGGQRHGLYTTWWSTGNKRAEGAYRRGLRDGAWLRWSAAGALLGALHLREGNGTWAEWYASGELRERGPMRDDRPDGRWRGWHERGALMYEGEYANHARVAETWHFYDRFGQPSSRRAARGPSRRPGGLVARLSAMRRASSGLRGVLGGNGGRGGRTGGRTGGQITRSRPIIKVGGVKRVSIAYLSTVAKVHLDDRQARILRVLIHACAQRFKLHSAGATVRPRGGGATVHSNALRWTLLVRANGTVRRVTRTHTPASLADKGGLRCADYVVARARFKPRAGRPGYQVTLTATLIH